MSQRPVKICLGRNLFAVVDGEDAERVDQHLWHARAAGTTYYAATSAYVGRPDMRTMHRFILKPDREQVIDHINGNGLDNRRENLRFCDSAKNSRNTYKTKAKTTSKFKGVHWSDSYKRWIACITFENEAQILGRFDDESEAARAYDEAAVRLFGEYAKTNHEMGLYDGEVERVSHFRRNRDLAGAPMKMLPARPDAATAELELERLINTQKAGGVCGVERLSRANRQRRKPKKGRIVYPGAKFANPQDSG